MPDPGPITQSASANDAALPAAGRRALARIEAERSIIAARAAVEPERLRAGIAERWDTLNADRIRELGKFDAEAYRNLGVGFGVGALVTPVLGIAGIGNAVAISAIMVAGVFVLACAAVATYIGGRLILRRSQEDAEIIRLIG